VGSDGVANEEETYDLAILGGGPGGYVAAIRAAQLGLRCALVERDAVGGVCLNWGCIPSKVLLHCAEVVALARRGNEFGLRYDGLSIDYATAVDRSREVVRQMVDGVEGLLHRHGVEVIGGTGRLEAPGLLRVEPDGRLVRARHVILATGATAKSLPGLPVDGVRVLTSREALELRQVPTAIAIVGGGAVGVEFAWLFATYGATVTLIEMAGQLLPGEDRDVAHVLERSFRTRGIDVHTGHAVESVDVREDGVTVRYAGIETAVDCVLVATGIEPNSSEIGARELGITDDRGFVQVDERCRTSTPGVYAIGDLTGKIALAHVASAQGVTAVEDVAGLRPPPLDYDTMPRAVYCQPEIAALGLTEAAARERGFEAVTGRFPFRANGRAIALGQTEGMVKVVVDRPTGQLLGFHLIGYHAAELIGEASAGRLLEMTAEELGYAVHAHPTLSEALKEAALASLDGAIHFFDPSVSARIAAS
jgi:dihydrolipoamide dehydrogenase